MQRGFGCKKTILFILEALKKAHFIPIGLEREREREDFSETELSLDQTGLKVGRFEII